MIFLRKFFIVENKCGNIINTIVYTLRSENEIVLFQMVMIVHYILKKYQDVFLTFQKLTIHYCWELERYGINSATINNNFNYEMDG